VRVNGTGVCGLHSDDFDFVPVRLEPGRFGFAVRFEPLQLLPGKYLFRAHALDPEGLRLFDTVSVEFTVAGEARITASCARRTDGSPAAASHSTRPERRAPDPSPHRALPPAGGAR